LPGFDLKAYLADNRQFADSALDSLLPDENVEPAILHKAMRYSVFAGGKRIRPILAVAGAQAVGGDRLGLERVITALECIHTYSLIHDDLPSMDNDDLRRGKPTAHKVFGEAVAILAGDALLTFAFETLTSEEALRTCPPQTLLEVLSDLGTAAGSMNLVAGQIMDIINEGNIVDRSTAEAIINKKTAALISASITVGARMAGARPGQIRLLGKFGEAIGALFQIKDDLLDLEGDPEKLGKAVNKDRQRGKATLPRLIGRVESVEAMNDLLESSREFLEPFGDDAAPLRAVSEFIVNRNN
jgi:geranylgeranyl diphosphate synthase, type II